MFIFTYSSHIQICVYLYLCIKYTYNYIYIYIYLNLFIYTYIYIYMYLFIHMNSICFIFFEGRFSSQVAAVALLTAGILSKLLRRPLPKGPGAATAGAAGSGGGLPMVWANHCLVREIILFKMAELHFFSG